MNQVIRVIKNYPERIALAVCLLIAFIFLMKVLSPSREPGIDNTEKKIADLKKLINSKDPPSVSEIKHFETIKGRWGATTPAQESGNWLMYRQPVYEIRFGGTDATGKPLFHLPPIFKSITPTLPDTIELTWLKNPETTPAIKIKKYTIYRKAKEDKTSSKIELPIDSLTPTDSTYIYIDKSVSPTTEYTYYITSYTEDKNIQKQDQESGSSAKLSITTEDDVKFDGKNSLANGDAVWLSVSKYTRGGWQKQPGGLYKKGDAVGKDTGYFVMNIELIEKEVEISPGMKSKKKTYRITYQNPSKNKTIVQEVGTMQ